MFVFDVFDRLLFHCCLLSLLSSVARLLAGVHRGTLRGAHREGHASGVATAEEV